MQNRFLVCSVKVIDTLTCSFDNFVTCGPLKITGVILIYLRWGAILIKDNLAKRNLQGSKTCCLCHKEETIRHLFYCQFARAIWLMIQVASCLSISHSVSYLFMLGTSITCFLEKSKSLTCFLAAGAGPCVWHLGCKPPPPPYIIRLLWINCSNLL